jgi:hypothetical protein
MSSLRGACAALAASSIFGIQQADAATLHVDASASAPGDGSVESPYTSLQDAIDASVTGDSVQVAEGTYAPIVVSNKSIELAGGYGSDFGMRDRDAHVTRIAGSGSGAVVLLDVAGTTVVDGFYISGGARGVVSDGSPYAEQSPLIRNNVIEDNVGDAGADGGGIWCKTNLVIEGNVIRRNHAGRGAGIFCVSYALDVSHNLVEENIGHGDHGGGMFVGAGELTIAKNLVRNNVTGFGGDYGVGGGILVVGPGTVATLTGNVVTGNQAPKRGAGIFIDDESDATLSHDIVYANGCGYAGGAGITVDGYDETRPSKARLVHVTVAEHDCTGTGEGLQIENSNVIVENSIFWGNGDDFASYGESSLEVRYTLSRELFEGEGMVHVDPQFADPANGDFHVMSSHGRYVDDDGAASWVMDAVDSPALDAADPSASFGFEPMPNGARADLGAYGNTLEASKSVGSANGGLSVGPSTESEFPPPMETVDPSDATPAVPSADSSGGCGCESVPPTRPRWVFLAVGTAVAFFWLRRRAAAAAVLEHG